MNRNIYKITISISVIVTIIFLVFQMFTEYSAKMLPDDLVICINHKGGWGGYILYEFIDGNRIKYTYGRGFVSDYSIGSKKEQIISSGIKHIRCKEQRALVALLKQTEHIPESEAVADTGFEIVLLHNGKRRETGMRVVRTDNALFRASNDGDFIVQFAAELMTCCKPRKLSGELLLLHKWIRKHHDNLGRVATVADKGDGSVDTPANDKGQGDGSPV